MSTPPGIDYAALIQDALRGVVRDLLARVADEGLPGEHFFYLTFRTDGEGVEMPAALRAAYPEEMTVVLQHRYRELVVDDAAFAVTLFFDGQPQRLCVPWSALSAFVDPSAELGLRFDPEPDEAPARSADEGPSNVVSFDRFRGGGPGEPESCGPTQSGGRREAPAGVGKVGGQRPERSRLTGSRQTDGAGETPLNTTLWEFGVGRKISDGAALHK